MEEGKDYRDQSRPDAGFGAKNQTSSGHDQSDELKKQYKKHEKLDKDQAGNDSWIKVLREAVKKKEKNPDIPIEDLPLTDVKYKKKKGR